MFIDVKFYGLKTFKSISEKQLKRSISKLNQ